MRPIGEEIAVANYYLLKTEPTEYSFADLMKDRETEWDGVSNPTAVKNLRSHGSEEFARDETRGAADYL